MVTLSTDTKRPRNVDWPRAGAILYGDWGTSKAYVVGLAFAVAGYSSFWLILAMVSLTALVGLNYLAICKQYPEGGGVYASVRHRSEILSIVGAFLLIADYIVTAAISAYSAFTYLKVPHPGLFAGGAIALIGALNWFGPKTTGGAAVLVSVPTVIVVLLLGIFSIPHLGEAARNLQPLEGGLTQNWAAFVGLVLALSGVEAIATSTGVMKLDPGSSPEKPSIARTSTPALLVVMLEVCVFTALLAFAMHALPGLTRVPGPTGYDVNAPGHEGVRDYMLRYMGETFVGQALGHGAGVVMGYVVSFVFGFLLLSAVNTAVGALIATFFLMSRDREMPARFQSLNRFGVPALGLAVATIIPAVLVVAVSDLNGLADLYAVGVVGAIAMDIGASATNPKLGFKRWERVLMIGTALIMIGIELSLLVDKPRARVFVITILAIGLILRALAREKAQRGPFLVILAAVAALALDGLFVLHDVKTLILVVTVVAFGLILRGLFSERALRKQVVVPTTPAAMNSGSPPPGPPAVVAAGALVSPNDADELTGAPMLCAVRGLGRTLDFAIEEARESKRPLYLLFVREQFILTSEDTKRKWQQDDEARTIFLAAKEKANGHIILPCYAVSDSPADTIVDITATVGASRLILGAPQRSALVHLLRGNIIQQVASLLPEDIHLLVYA